MAKNKFYAYYLKGSNEKGIVSSWDRCKSVVSGKQGAMYKGFKTEQDAKTWLEDPKYDRKTGGSTAKNSKPNLPKGIYWDAGTGGGKGVEVRITDEIGTPLLFTITPIEELTKNGDYLLTKGETNNYGELVGAYAAIKIANKLGEKLVLGDSTLIITYWSRGRVNRKNVTDAKTIALAKSVTELRNEFEANGGEVRYISGDHNPADLGYHRKKR